MKLQFFTVRAITPAHWQFQNWQFGIESHRFIHSLIHSLPCKELEVNLTELVTSETIKNRSYIFASYHE